MGAMGEEVEGAAQEGKRQKRPRLAKEE